MRKKPLHYAWLCLLLCSLSASAQVSAGPGSKPVDRAVAQRALAIVSGVHGTWTQMPGEIATRLMTGGALIGNGSVGVAIGGTPEKQQYYVGRDDFWSVQRGMVMPVGQLQFLVPSLAGATAQMKENIASGDVTARFQAGQAQMNTRAWVGAEKNVFYVEVRNPGTSPLNVGLGILDGFGQDDRETLGGRTGEVFWRRISPEVVHATIGGPNDKKGQLLNADVRSVQIFDSLQTGRATPTPKPIYAWKATDPVWANRAGTAEKPFFCGDIIFPEARFTVRAAVRADQAASGVIFSSVSQHWRMQVQDPSDPLGNVRGMTLGGRRAPRPGSLSIW